MPVFTHLLFDFDHMLFDTDSSEAAAFGDALRSSGVETPDQHLADYQRINQGMWRQVEAGTLSPNDVKVRRYEALKTELGFEYDSQKVADSYTEGLIRHGELFRGAWELLETLRRQFSLGMVTNGIGVVQRGRIERLGLGPFFDSVVISGEVGVSKPRPEIFGLARTQLGHPAADRCLMIGDSLASDMQGGANASISTAWFNPNQSPNTTDITPTFEFNDYDTLVELLVST